MATSTRSHQSRYLASLLLLWIIPLTVYGLAASTSKKRNSGTGFGATKKDSWRLHTPDDTTTTATLTAFLSKQKAAIENTEIGLDPVTGERGLYATKNFKEGQIICKVPSDCALALSDPALAVKDQEAPTLADGGLFFLQQYWKDTTARKLWAPYLDTLPVSARAAKTPDLYQDDELDLLEFPRIVNKARQRQAEVRDLAAAATKDSITLEELQFATWLVSTRAFPIQLADQDDAETAATALDERGQVISKAARKWIRVLVPWIDVTNHAAAPNAALTLQDPEKDQAWFALKATRPIPQGREITLSYGSGVDSSVELLLNYGFVPAENQIDTLMLRKGGDDCIAGLDGWTTTLEEDQAMLAMTSEQDVNLRNILSFRIQMKQSYSKV